MFLIETRSKSCSVDVRLWSKFFWYPGVTKSLFTAAGRLVPGDKTWGLGEVLTNAASNCPVDVPVLMPMATLASGVQ